jgi:hypothetical protein
MGNIHRYVLGALMLATLQAVIVLSCKEFYIHKAPRDNMIQFNGTTIEFNAWQREMHEELSASSDQGE